MSYKSDMEFYREQHTKRKRLMGSIVKVSILVLAAAVLALTVSLVVTFAFSDRSAAEEDEGGADRSRPVLRLNESALVGGKAVAYIGESIAYKSFVTISDNGGEVTLSVDTSAVNPSAEGEYPVRYTATDAAGNKSTLELILVVKNGDYTPAKLNALVAAKAKELGISADMSKKVIVERVYAFVNSPNLGKNDANIYFSDVSNTPAQQLSRDTWQTDWVEEACRTLSMSRMEGDCYTYYAVSKAFFDYFGIENMGIQRAASSSEAGTHFWSIVNIGSAEEPQWYYYDATRLAGGFASDKTKNACLITEQKLQSYRTSQGGTEFYKFDKWDGFPAIAEN